MSRSRGFSLLELVIALAVFLSASLCVLPLFSEGARFAQSNKISVACRLLATDMSFVQNKSLYGNLNGDSYSLMLDRYGDGYTVIRGQKVYRKVVFSEKGLAPVIATCASTNKFAFTANGAPKSSASINVYCSNVPNKSKFVEIQPITGRIVIRDG